MPSFIPCWWYLSGQCRHMAERGPDKCDYLHGSYAAMLALTSFDSGSLSRDPTLRCLPSCDRYELPWDAGYGCCRDFKWWLFRTPTECPCRARRRELAEEEAEAEAEAEADECSDDDVIVVKREGEDGYERQQERLQRLRRVGMDDEKSVEKEEEKEESEQGEKDDRSEAEPEEAEGDEDVEEKEEWTAILPVPLHYLCLRALTAAPFAIFLRSAMRQTERDNGVHVVMHQQPCDARRPLQWGHVILYGSRDEVERGKKALCAVLDSGYQYTADGRLLVAVVQQLSDEAEGKVQPPAVTTRAPMLAAPRAVEYTGSDDASHSEDDADSYGARESESSDTEAYEYRHAWSRMRRPLELDDGAMNEEMRELFDDEDYERDDEYWRSVAPPPPRAAAPTAPLDPVAPPPAPASARAPPRRSARIRTGRKRHQTAHPTANSG